MYITREKCRFSNIKILLKLLLNPSHRRLFTLKCFNSAKWNCLAAVFETSSSVFLVLKCLLLQIPLKLYFKRSISVTALITKHQQKYQCYCSIKKSINYPKWNAMFPFGFLLNCKPSNGCFPSEPGQICKIQTCQGVKLNKTRFGFTRGAAVKKRAINNASQNLKPAGLDLGGRKESQDIWDKRSCNIIQHIFLQKPRICM